MQKKIIALALAAAAGSAFAQTNVTIYGVADATFDNVRANGATTGTAQAYNGSNFNSRNRVTANSSYIGFRGTEDLGNGLKALFQFENAISQDNTGGTWANRDSFVGVSGGFGTVLAGNLTGPTRALAAKLDVNNGATGIGANTAILGKLGGGAGAGAFDQRISNAIAYASPVFSGFSGVAAYSTGYNTAVTPGYAGGVIPGAEEAKGAQGGVVAVAAPTTNTAWTLGLNYDNGPIYVGYAYTRVSVHDRAAPAALATTTEDVDNHRVGAKYTAAWGTVGLMWDRTKLDVLSGPGANGSDLKQNVWLLPVTVNVGGAGKVIGQYGKAGDVKGNGNLNQGASFFALGYEHALSKRTVLKAVYSQITNKADANYDYLYGVSQANSTGYGAGVTPGADPRGFSIGVRHSF